MRSRITLRLFPGFEIPSDDPRQRRFVVSRALNTVRFNKHKVAEFVGLESVSRYSEPVKSRGTVASASKHLSLRKDPMFDSASAIEEMSGLSGIHGDSEQLGTATASSCQVGIEPSYKRLPRT